MADEAYSEKCFASNESMFSLVAISTANSFSKRFLFLFCLLCGNYDCGKIMWWIEIYRDNDVVEYKVRYEESQDKIEELKRKLVNKNKAYNELQAKYEALLEKHNWET